MIYLLGGPPRCGKTTIARRLAGAIGSPWLQTDYLESAFATYVPAGEYAPRVLDAGPGVPRERRNDAVYARYSAAEIIGYYRALAGRTWPGLRAIVEYALFDGEDLVLEGFHLDPADIRPFLVAADPREAAQVRPAFLVREDLNDTLASIRRGGHKNDWVLTKTQQEITFTRIARMITQYGAAIRAEAKQAGFPVFTMDGDFDRQAEATLKRLCA